VVQNLRESICATVRESVRCVGMNMFVTVAVCACVRVAVYEAVSVSVWLPRRLYVAVCASVSPTVCGCVLFAYQNLISLNGIAKTPQVVDAINIPITHQTKITLFTCVRVRTCVSVFANA